MTTFMNSSLKFFLLVKAVKEIKKEIEVAGLDRLKFLAENDVSIVGKYLETCSAAKKAQLKRDFTTLLSLGGTPEMVLTELARQMPVLAPIMEGKEGYKKSEIEKLERFVRES